MVRESLCRFGNMGLLRVFLLVSLCLLGKSAADQCSSLQESLGKSWLESERRLRTGRATGLALTLCQTTRLFVQLWEERGNQTAKLIWQLEIPSQRVTGQTSVVQFKAGEYVDVTGYHRLGLYSPVGERVPVARIWDASMPQLLASQLDGPFTDSETYEFSDLGHPYRFAIDFCNEDVPDCSVPEVTTRPVIPSSSIPAGCGSLESHGGKVLLEARRPLVQGTLRALHFNVCLSTEFVVQLWAPVDVDSYQLVWSKSVNPKHLAENKTMHIVNLEVGEQVQMRAEYRLGLHSPGTPDSQFPVPYRFAVDGGNLVRSTQTGQMGMCSHVKFDDLLYPQTFSLELCNITDCLPFETQSQAEGSLVMCNTNRTSNPESDGKTERSTDSATNFQKMTSLHFLKMSLFLALLSILE